MQHEFQFSHKTPVLVRAWHKLDLIIFELLKKNVIDVNILDEYIKQTKICRPKCVLRWEFADVYLVLLCLL